MKHVLITGKNSYVGSAVKDWLLKDKNEFYVEEVDTVDRRWKKIDFSQFDYIFHVAGIAHVNAKSSQESLYYKINTDLTAEIAAHAKAAGVKRFIFMSSMIVYGESKKLKNPIITKDTVPRPNGFYGNSKLQAEIKLHELEDDSFKAIILRPPMIYGPGCKGNFPKLISFSKKTPIIPAFHNKRSMLFIDNLCEFIKQVILNDVSGILFPQNAEYSDTCELIRELGRLQGKKIHLSPFFNFVVYLASPFIGAVNKVFGDSYYSLDMSEYDFCYQSISLMNSLNMVLM